MNHAGCLELISNEGVGISNLARKLCRDVTVSSYVVHWCPATSDAGKFAIEGNTYECEGEIRYDYFDNPKRRNLLKFTVTSLVVARNTCNKMHVNFGIDIGGGESLSFYNIFISTPDEKCTTCISKIPPGMIAMGKRTSFIVTISLIILKESNLNETHGQLSTDFEKMYIDQDLTDVTFVFDNDKEIKAHKLILMARSPVFRAMFQSGMQESNGNPVEIKDLEREVFEDLVRYMYTGKLNVTSQDTLVDVMMGAERYGLIEFRDYCEKELVNRMNIEIAAGSLLASDLLNLDYLKKKTIEFILSKKQEFLKTEGYKKIVKTNVLLLSELFERL